MASMGEDEDEGFEVSNRLFLLLILGVALVLLGIVVLAVASLVLGGSTSVSGVVFIGPFPIVFGSGPNVAFLIVIGVILAVLSVVVFLVMNRKRGWF